MRGGGRFWSPPATFTFRQAPLLEALSTPQANIGDRVGIVGTAHAEAAPNMAGSAAEGASARYEGRQLLGEAAALSGDERDMPPGDLHQG